MTHAVLSRPYTDICDTDLSFCEYKYLYNVEEKISRELLPN